MARTWRTVRGMGGAPGDETVTSPLYRSPVNGAGRPRKRRAPVSVPTGGRCTLGRCPPRRRSGPRPTAIPGHRAPDRVDHRVTLLVGLAGSVAIGVGALFVGRLAPTHSAALLVSLQHLASHRHIGYGLVTLGLLVLTGAWVLLGSQARYRPGGVRRVLVATTAWSVPMFVTPPLFSGDVWSTSPTG